MGQWAPALLPENRTFWDASMNTNYSRHRRILLGVTLAAILFLAGFGYGYRTPDDGKAPHHGPDAAWIASLDCG